MATDIAGHAGPTPFPSPTDWLAGPPATHSTPLSSSSSRRRRRPINQFRGLPYASLSARRETGEAVGHLPVRPRRCLPEPIQRLLCRHYSHPPTRPQLISDALAGKRTRLGSYKLPGRSAEPGGLLLSGRASIWCWAAGAGWRGNQYPQGCLIVLQPTTQHR